jgi:hypothetical protein
VESEGMVRDKVDVNVIVDVEGSKFGGEGRPSKVTAVKTDSLGHMLTYMFSI